MNTSHSMMMLMLGIALIASGSAHAVTLEVDPAASVWAHLGAQALLILHIGGGAVGLVSGATACATRKGGTVHRKAGKIFFVSMAIAYLIGALVAPFLSEGQRPNFVAGILALYLLLSGVAAARRRGFRAGSAEKTGLVVALLVTGMGIFFAVEGASSTSGTVDGSPPQAFLVFILAGSIAAAGEINVLIRRELTNAARTLRHLWRMCASFFIASGSLFFGQPQVFPDWFNASFLSPLLAMAPLLVLLFWVVRMRLIPQTN